jgi:ribosome-binding factor A
MNERRNERLASFVRGALPDFFRDECALALGTLVSIVHIEINEAGSRADVFVSVFPDEAHTSVAKELKIRENEANHFIRMQLRSKHSPLIRFHVH